ncbi:MAG: hypothetical protein E7146_07185 [Rikenellaceae bacterium]|nr:hypothetical protein [Rikenellaceae bacterium]
MQRSFRLIYIIGLVLLMTMPFAASAQTSSINAYSPYSMYGPGELMTPGSVQMRSLGGIGIGMRAIGQINPQNPAAASIAPRKSFLFDFGIDGTHFRNSQPKYNAQGEMISKAKTVYNSANIHSIALTFPVYRNLGVSLNVSPYSSVGYKVKTTDQNQDNWADIGRVMYGYEGEGDITEVKLSVGWAPWRRLSIGVAAKYYWGDITRSYKAQVTDQITGIGTFSPTVGRDNYVVSNFKFQFGLQWNILLTETRIFTLGATYDLGGVLNPKKESYVYTDNIINSIQSIPVRDRINSLELRVPHQFGVGLFFRDRAIAWGVDYVYAAWGSNNSSYQENTNPNNLEVTYCNTHTIKLGFELTPRVSDVRNYLNRISYRVGARLGNNYQMFGGQRVNEMAITAGLGFPVKVWGASSVNVGFEYGRRSVPGTANIGAQKIGLVNQNYYKVSIGFSLFSADTSDYWFVRQKYD